ncbi:Sorting and assembly machinery component 50 homolog B [Linum perenne]
MANPDHLKPDPISENPKNDADDIEDDNGDSGYEEDEEEEEQEFDDEEEVEPEPRDRTGRIPQSAVRMQKAKLQNLFQRLQTQRVPLRVHDVLIKGNTKTKDYLIEAETALLKNCTTMQEILEVSRAVSFRLQALEIFDSVNITLDSGPPELPGTSNVIVEVHEAKSMTGEVGAYTKGEAKSSTIEGTLKFRNLFGHGDLWDGSFAYGWDHLAEVSAGVHFPRFRGSSIPLDVRAFLLSQDWLKFSSFKERSMGLSVNLFSTGNHDLVYNLGWRTLMDPSQMASRSVRRQLGHSLLSSLKYTFKIDRRNSPLRPVRGYAFAATSQIAGLAPDSRFLRFVRQEIDLRYAIPLGMLNAALNLGISGGVVFPWGNGSSGMPSPLPDRFFLGGNSSPICNLGGPTTVWGYRTRGLGPTEPRRHPKSDAGDENTDPGVDYLGGDLAVTAFADLSFDLPLKWFRARGIHGHIFTSAGNLEKLTQNAYKDFSLQKFASSFRTSVGAGIVVPMRPFRLELNYYHMLKRFEHDRGKPRFGVTFST